MWATTTSISTASMSGWFPADAGSTAPEVGGTESGIDVVGAAVDGAAAWTVAAGAGGVAEAG